MDKTSLTLSEQDFIPVHVDVDSHQLPVRTYVGFMKPYKHHPFQIFENIQSDEKFFKDQTNHSFYCLCRFMLVDKKDILYAGVM